MLVLDLIWAFPYFIHNFDAQKNGAAIKDM